MKDNVRQFLEKPNIAYLSTIDLEGSPHTVPVWFAVNGDDLITSAAESRARVKHVLANPKGAMTVGGNLDETEGHMFKGEISIEHDPTRVLLHQIVRRYIPEEAIEQFLAQVGQEERLIFRLTPTKVIKVR